MFGRSFERPQLVEIFVTKRLCYWPLVNMRKAKTFKTNYRTDMINFQSFHEISNASV